ncbi:DUF4292 domain-containing protein [Bacteroidota bacterium]
MRKSNSILLFVILTLSSCSMTRRIADGNSTETINLEQWCDSAQVIYKTLYINKIDVNLEIEEQEYDAKLSVYYIPDSVFYVSAVNSGFEIVRMGLTKDSLVYINRLDKVVIIIKMEDLGYEDLITFSHLEDVVNPARICMKKDLLEQKDNKYILDDSSKDIRREISFTKLDLTMSSFEFFHKKTSEYIVGERTNLNEITIYSNYLVDELVLKTYGGQLTFNKELNINLEVNRNKYDIVYL